MYGGVERVLDEALEKRGRNRATIATKVWTSNDREVQRQIERSLSYFGGRIELYQVHNLVPVERRLDTLHRLKDEGRVCDVGATHHSGAAFGNLISVMQSGRVDFVQIPYNAAETSVTEELLPLAEELGLGVIVVSPQEYKLAQSVLPRRVERWGPAGTFGESTSHLIPLLEPPMFGGLHLAWKGAVAELSVER
jgi:aryl-alcohol dehydrogenase-like predicted oxidoreductase